MRIKISLFILSIIILSCSAKREQREDKIRVIFDTDANNELDDQHALAYLLFNGKTFDVAGVTVNATRGGGDIEKQFAEAERVIKLCGLDGKIPLYKGANKNFDSIQHHVLENNFDGSDAVNFIIKEASQKTDKKLLTIAVGKLANIALALKKDPSLENKMKVIWLGSNYPDPGEYNLDNDTASLNFVLKTNIEFEMVTVRYGKPSGTAAVAVTKDEINQKMPGKGPHINTAVTGRHGGTFTNFGDYSLNLFQHIDYHGTPPSRALYDMVAVAIVKNPSWGKKFEISAPYYFNDQWNAIKDNGRKIFVWENFDKEKILNDFYNSMDHYELVTVH